MIERHTEMEKVAETKIAIVQTQRQDHRSLLGAGLNHGWSIVKLSMVTGSCQETPPHPFLAGIGGKHAGARRWSVGESDPGLDPNTLLQPLDTVFH